jgi:glutamine amidotransferase
MRVAVVNLGVGNTASMMFALERLGADARLTDDPTVIGEADKVILPGVGAAAYAMGRIRALGLNDVLTGFERPLLGVCLGQQLLYDRSQEGDALGLGLIEGEVFRLESAPERPVPHMGWNSLEIVRDDPLLEGIKEGTYVYFVHTFACPISDATLAAGDYGGRFSAVVHKNNVFGCQFHPELSSKDGARILQNFLDIPC